MGNNSFKDLIDFGTFSLVRLFRNLTPPSGGCGPLVALGLDRIKRYGCRCSGQTVYTDARAYLMHVVYLCMFYHIYFTRYDFKTLLIWFI